MNILLTNDDGINSKGLWALYEQLSETHSVTIVAPDRERSAVGHGITLHSPLRSTEIRLNGGHQGYAVNGTPADCVKLGVVELLDSKPDMVISGINPGSNLGNSINYSGTVAAAKEAALYGLPAIAVSVQVPPSPVPGRDGPVNYEGAAFYTRKLAQKLFEEGLPFGTILNVNIPAVPFEKIAGIRITSQHVTLIDDYFEKRIDPRNREYYWMGRDTRNFGKNPDNDGAAICQNYISVTPIRCDMTDYSVLEDWRLKIED